MFGWTRWPPLRSTTWLQVPRILAPLVTVVEQLPKLCRDPHLMRYVTDTFGGVEECRKQILQDFFR